MSRLWPSGGVGPSMRAHDQAPEAPRVDPSAAPCGSRSGGRMATVKINEGYTLRSPMGRHVAEGGWTAVPPEQAEAKRQGRANMLFRHGLEAKLLESNSWLSEGHARAIVDTIDALPTTIEGN